MFVWDDPWNGYFGPRSAVAVADCVEDAEEAVKKSLRAEFTNSGFKLPGRIKKMGPPSEIRDISVFKAAGITFYFEGSHRDELITLEKPKPRARKHK